MNGEKVITDLVRIRLVCGAIRIPSFSVIWSDKGCLSFHKFVYAGSSDEVLMHFGKVGLLELCLCHEMQACESQQTDLCFSLPLFSPQSFSQFESGCEC
mmetsp:Transcript_2183/g.7996  ORF Transcript_2183/g.7996 Transcript_2183/m.7996 type:complete len:99 (+) Transcript_2183:85-381(+)